MRCSRKSTTWRGSAVILWVIAASGVTAAQADGDAMVRAVVTHAVQVRVGARTDVSIDLRVLDMPAGARLDDAVPEPGARIGRAARFRLRAGGRSVGFAIGIVHVTTPHLRVARPIAAGATITAEDVT